MEEYKLKSWNITQCIRRVNKKLYRCLVGQKAAEEMSMGWALPRFLREAWGSTKRETSANSGTQGIAQGTI